MKLNIPPNIGEYGYFDITTLLKDGEEILGFYIYSTSKEIELIHGSYPEFKNEFDLINKGIVVKLMKVVKYIDPL